MVLGRYPILEYLDPQGSEMISTLETSTCFTTSLDASLAELGNARSVET